jgi:hypothetical protein
MMRIEISKLLARLFLTALASSLISTGYCQSPSSYEAAKKKLFRFDALTIFQATNRTSKPDNYKLGKPDKWRAWDADEQESQVDRLFYNLRSQAERRAVDDRAAHADFQARNNALDQRLDQERHFVQSLRKETEALAERGKASVQSHLDRTEATSAEHFQVLSDKWPEGLKIKHRQRLVKQDEWAINGLLAVLAAKATTTAPATTGGAKAAAPAAVGSQATASGATATPAALGAVARPSAAAGQTATAARASASVAWPAGKRAIDTQQWIAHMGQLNYGKLLPAQVNGNEVLRRVAKENEYFILRSLGSNIQGLPLSGAMSSLVSVGAGLVLDEVEPRVKPSFVGAVARPSAAAGQTATAATASASVAWPAGKRAIDTQQWMAHMGQLNYGKLLPAQVNGNEVLRRVAKENEYYILRSLAPNILGLPLSGAMSSLVSVGAGLVLDEGEPQVKPFFVPHK